MEVLGGGRHETYWWDELLLGHWGILMGNRGWSRAIGRLGPRQRVSRGGGQREAGIQRNSDNWAGNASRFSSPVPVTRGPRWRVGTRWGWAERTCHRSYCCWCFRPWTPGCPGEGPDSASPRQHPSPCSAGCCCAVSWWPPL